MKQIQECAAAVTGVNGFVGQHLMTELKTCVPHIYGFSRDFDAHNTVARTGYNYTAFVGDLNELDVSQIAQRNIQVGTFYHLAGRAHRPRELKDQSFADQFTLDNVRATQNAFEIAEAMDAKRFVYMSSIKVLGDTSNKPFTPQDPARPADLYAKSKHQAEQLLADLQAESNVKVTIVRPPLIYGPAVAGNFLSLLALTQRSLPLPLAGALAYRSLLGVNNLCDLLAHHVHKDDADYRVLHVRDPHELNVSQLVTQLAELMQTPSRLFYLPTGLLRFLAACIGRADQIARVFDSLQVDDSQTRKLYSWIPPKTTQEQLQETVDCWMKQH